MVCSDKEGKGIEAYGERWQIETLFGCLKSKGFNLEDTHMTASAKTDRLMSVLAIGFVLFYRAGAGDKRRAIKVKKHGRPAQSLFRAWLDRLVPVLFRGMRLLEFRRRGDGFTGGQREGCGMKDSFVAYEVLSI